MLVTGIKKSDLDIRIITKSHTISFKLHPDDTPQKIVRELIHEDVKIINFNYLEKLLKIVLYSRFTGVM